MALAEVNQVVEDASLLFSRNFSDVISDNKALGSNSYRLPVNFNQNMDHILKKAYTLDSMKAAKFSVSAESAFSLKVCCINIEKILN